MMSLFQYCNKCKGNWDCTTPGFEDQINLIDNLLDKLNK